MTNKVIMYDSPEAAQLVTVTGWATKDGRFFGDNEHLARHAGSTHRRCDNNKDHAPYRKNAYCEPCAAAKRIEVFNAMPVVEWDGEAPLNLFDTDLYFYNLEQILEYCDEYGLDITGLQLVLCEPVSMYLFSEDYWEDCFADDVDLPGEIQAALNDLNAAIEEHGKAVSWSPGNKRVIYVRIKP